MDAHILIIIFIVLFIGLIINIFSSIIAIIDLHKTIKENKFKRVRIGLKQGIELLAILLMVLINIGYMDVNKKVEFNKVEAEKLLRETYDPLQSFIKELTISEEEGLLVVPNYIKSEADFINLFNGKMEEDNAKDLYERLIVEKNDRLFVNAYVYIPGIYDENGKVIRAYTKKREKVYSKFFKNNDKSSIKLIIKEESFMDGEYSTRTNYYIKNQNGKWILDYRNGTSAREFVNIKHNPWSKYWKDNI